MAGKVSTVDRRYVFWLERAKITGIIPIEEMTAESLQLIHCPKRFFQSFDTEVMPSQPKSRAARTESR